MGLSLPGGGSGRPDGRLCAQGKTRRGPMLGERAADPARLQEAVRSFQAALVVFRDAKADYYTQQTEQNLQRAQDAISQ